MKAKLVNQKLVYAPKVIVYNNIKYVGNIPDEILRELGYKDVVITEVPRSAEGYHTISHYEEFSTNITLVWDVVENSSQEKVAELKQKLFDTDYQAIKYAEGWIIESDYAPMKDQRQAWRDEINELENNVE